MKDNKYRVTSFRDETFIDEENIEEVIYRLNTNYEMMKELYEDSVEEIERLNNDIKILLQENGNKEKVIKAQDNIIKEVREYIEYQLENLDFEEDTKAKMLGAMVLVLLDKENNNV